MAEQTYINIARPYDDNLQRKDDLSYVLGGVITPGSEGGSVEEVSVKTGGSLADLWITKRISSFNWKPKKTGFMMDGQTGYAEFTDVFVSGAITAISGSFGGWSLSSTAIYYDGAGASTSAGMAPGDYPFYAGQTYANRASAPFRVTVAGIIYATGAVIDGTSTIGGRTASTIATAIDSSGAFINANLNTSAKTILGSFTFSGSGAIAMNTDANNGLWLSPTGLLGKSGGVTTFAIDTNGNATFAGTLSGASGTFGTITSGTISGVTITGSTLSTAPSGQRTVLSSTFLDFFNSSNINSGRIYGTGTSLLIDSLQASSGIVLSCGSSGFISFTAGASTKLMFSLSNNNLYPWNDNQFALGYGSNRWSDIQSVLLNATTLNLTGTATIGTLSASGSVTGSNLSGTNTGDSSGHTGLAALNTQVNFTTVTTSNWIQVGRFIYMAAISGATASGETALNGSMYYRTDDNTIRVYINGGWRSLSHVA